MVWNETEALEKFELSKRRIKAKEELLEDLKNELFLLDNQLFNSYKSQIVYMVLDEKTIRDAEKWLKMVKNNTDSDCNKLDKRKNYPEKQTYLIFLQTLKGYFGVEDLVITKIYHINFDSSFGIEFTFDNHEWTLEIPNVKRVGFDIYKQYGEYAFELSLWLYEGAHTRSLVGSTFIEEDLRDLLIQGVEKYEE